MISGLSRQAMSTSLSTDQDFLKRSQPNGTAHATPADAAIESNTACREGLGRVFLIMYAVNVSSGSWSNVMARPTDTPMSANRKMASATGGNTPASERWGSVAPTSIFDVSKSSRRLLAGSMPGKGSAGPAAEGTLSFGADIQG